MDTLGVIAVTVSPVLIAIIGWFVIRYISKNDTFKTNITKKLDDYAAEMKSETKKIEKAATDSQQAMLSFKSAIQDELYKVKVETTNMITNLKGASSEIKSLAQLCETTSKTVTEDHRIVNLTAKVTLANKTELEKLRTEVIKISDDIVLIKKKD